MTGGTGRVWLIAGAVCLGAVSGLHDVAAGAVIGGVAAAILILILILVTRRVPFVAVVIAAVALGVGTARRSLPDDRLLSMAGDVRRCDASGVVRERSSLGTFLEIERVACGGAWMVVTGRAVVDGDVGAPGSVFEARVRFVPLGSGGFAEALRRAGAAVRLDLLDVTVMPPRGVWAMAAGMRDSVRRVAGSLDGDVASLMLGLTIGDTSGMTGGDEEVFRRAGLTHLVAVSGSNVAIVLAAAVFLAAPLGLFAASATAAGTLALYVLVVGPEPSVLRAAGMGVISLVAIASGRRAEPLSALGLAVCAVVATRPYLVRSVGLHLSVAATAGLILWSRPIAQRIPGPRAVAVAVGVTLAAQFAVAPLLLGVFGQLSLVAPVANLLAAPAVVPATILGLAAGVASSVWAPAGDLLARLAGPAVEWILWVGRTFGAPSWASLEVAPMWGWLAGSLVVTATILSLAGHARLGLDP